MQKFKRDSPNNKLKHIFELGCRNTEKDEKLTAATIETVLVYSDCCIK